MDGKVVIAMELLTDSINKGMADAEKKMKGLEGAGKAMSVGVTAPIVAMGGAAVKLALDQETAFAQTKTLLTGSSSDMQKYKDEITKASNEMGISFEEYAESVYGSISAGVEQGEAIEFVAQASKLATGGFTDSATAADILTTAINAYGLETADATKISDMLVTTQNLGKTTVDELSASMGKVIPLAKANGVEFDALATSYAVLTKNGIATAEAGTYTKSMLGELGKTGSKTDKALREMTGNSFAELTKEGKELPDILAMINEDAEKKGLKLADYFGSSEAANAASVILDKKDEFKEFNKEMKDSGGATEEAFNTVSDTVMTEFNMAMNEMKNSLASFGEVMLPVASKIIGIFSKVISVFSGLPKPIRTIIIVVAGLLALIGPAILIFIKVVSVMKGLKSAITAVRTAVMFLTGSLSFWIIIIVAVIAVAYLLWKHWDKVTSFMKKAFEKVKEVIEKIRKPMDAITNGNFSKVLANWIQMFKDLWASAKKIFGYLKDALKGVTQVIFGLMTLDFAQVWEGLKGIGTALLGIFGEVLKSLYNIFMNTLPGILAGGALSAIKNVFSGIVDGLTALWDGLVAGVTWVLQAIWDAVVFYATLWLTAWKLILTTLWDFAVYIFTTVRDFIVTVFTTIWQFIVNIMTTIWEVYLNILTWIWELYVTIFNKIKEFIVTVFNAILMVITTVLNAVWTFIQYIFSAIVTSITGYLNYAKFIVMSVFTIVKTIIVETMMYVWENIKITWELIKQIFVNVLLFLKSLVTLNFSGMKTAIVNILTAIKTFITATWNSIKTFYSNTLGALLTYVKEKFEAMKTAVGDKMQAVLTKIKEIWGLVTGFFTGIDLKEIGKNIIMGLINGIGSMAKALATKVSDIAGSIKDGIAGVLKIHSPSRVTTEQGAFTGEGLEVGLLSQRKAVSTASKKLADDAIESMSGITALPDFGTDFNMKGKVKTAESNTGGKEYIDNRGGEEKNIIIQNMTVRSEEDIYKISRELDKLQKRREKSQR